VKIKMGRLTQDVKDLKAVIDEKKISPGIAARFIGCSERQAYRWIRGISIPSVIYRQSIRRGLRRIRKNL
jgi:hypothetical protein